MTTIQDVAQTIKIICDKKGISVNKLLTECGAGTRTYHNMMSGSFPSIDKFIKIADYLDVSVDYLLGRTDVVEVNRGYSYYPAEIAAYGAKGTKGEFTAPPKETT